MRVLLVQHGAFPGFVAPIPKELAKNLRREGVDVSVAAVGDYRSNTEGGGDEFSYPVHHVQARRPWLAYRALKPLVDRADIVHYFPGRGLELLPLLNRRAKYIFNHISVSVTGNAFKDGLIDLVKRAQPGLADLIVCTDRALADNLAPLISVPVELLPVGYPADLFYPCGPFQDGPERLLMYHGACRPQRRLERLVQVVAKLPTRYRLVIIGGGLATDEAYRAELGVLADRLGCGDRVELTNMPQSRTREVIERAYLGLSYVPVIDCFQDQFVLKSLEYLACQRPVLTTATRYNLEFQRRLGADRLLVADDTVDDMSASILSADPFVQAFHEPTSLQQLSQAMLEYTSAGIVERRLIPIYERLLRAS